MLPHLALKNKTKTTSNKVLEKVVLLLCYFCTRGHIYVYSKTELNIMESCIVHLHYFLKPPQTATLILAIILNAVNNRLGAKKVKCFMIQQNFIITATYRTVMKWIYLQSGVIIEVEFYYMFIWDLLAGVFSLSRCSFRWSSGNTVASKSLSQFLHPGILMFTTEQIIQLNKLWTQHLS